MGRTNVGKVSQLVTQTSLRISFNPFDLFVLMQVKVMQNIIYRYILINIFNALAA